MDFTGPAVRWIGGVAPNRGIAEVFIDGVSYGTVDSYASVRADKQVLFRPGWTVRGPPYADDCAHRDQEPVGYRKLRAGGRGRRRSVGRGLRVFVVGSLKMQPSACAESGLSAIGSRTWTVGTLGTRGGHRRCDSVPDALVSQR